MFENTKVGDKVILKRKLAPALVLTVTPKMESEVRTICIFSWIAWAVALVRIFS